MRIITVNVNGIRSAERKGFFRWLARQRADVVCLQELKAHLDQIDTPAFYPKSFHCYYHPAERPGYSGVGLFTRDRPDRIIEGFGSAEFDREGRYLEARFGRLSVISLYAPSGSSSDERQQAKYRFMDEFMPHLQSLRRRRALICGDWNIAHREIDLKNWRSNRKNSGFLPEERAWMDQVFGKGGFVDAFRRSMRDPSSTRGGPIAAGPGTRTWAGGSTTRWCRGISRTAPAASASTRIGGSPTTRR